MPATDGFVVFNGMFYFFAVVSWSLANFFFLSRFLSFSVSLYLVSFLIFLFSVSFDIYLCLSVSFFLFQIHLLLFPFFLCFFFFQCYERQI